MDFKAHIGSTIVMIVHVNTAYWVALVSHRHHQYDIMWKPYMFVNITKTSLFFLGGG